MSALPILAAAAARLPPLGLGLWKAPKGEAGAAVLEAVKAGYRLLDGAAVYGNEAEVGVAIKQAIDSGLCTRSELTVVSKCFNTMHVWKGDTSRPEAALRKTLADLQLEKVDVYLIHWPFAFEEVDIAQFGPMRGADGAPNPKIIMQIEYLETFRAMIELKKKGLCTTLGVCNLTLEQLQELVAAFPDDPPEILQVELHPYLAQPELTAYCKTQGITIMAYSPLGSGDSYANICPRDREELPRDRAALGLGTPSLPRTAFARQVLRRLLITK
jgi:alcohol dehydrogenase (NADP+)